MANLSVRIVDADYYFEQPIQDLDVCFSEFRQRKIAKVPVIRIFGSTPKGQKTCLHIHGVFPYFYVPLPNSVDNIESFIKHFAHSLESSINISLGKAPSQQQQHVYLVQVVKRIPFYGYHSKEIEFLKIYIYNPRLVTKVSELLLSGAILNQIFQPYETHIPYILQFFIDYNLHGMNLIHLSRGNFRPPLPIGDLIENTNASLKSPINFKSPRSSQTFSQTNYDVFNDCTVPSYLILNDLPRQSSCMLEVDAVEADIMNKDSIQGNIGANPGLNALWEDEKLRRRDNQESSVIEFPASPERTKYESAQSEQVQLQQLKSLLQERQSRSEVLSSSEENYSFQATLNSSGLDVTSSQLSSSLDQGIVDMLVEMAEEYTNTPLAETTLTNNGLVFNAGEDTEDDDDNETFLMSQKIQDQDEDEKCNIEKHRTGLTTSENESTSSSCKHAVDEEDCDNSWTNTFLGHIPQVDGSVDLTEQLESVKTFTKTNLEIHKQNSFNFKRKPATKDRLCFCKRNTPSSCNCLRFVIPQIDGRFDESNSDSSLDDFQPRKTKKFKTKLKKRSIRSRKSFVPESCTNGSLGSAMECKTNSLVDNDALNLSGGESRCNSYNATHVLSSGKPIVRVEMMSDVEIQEAISQTRMKGSLSNMASRETTLANIDDVQEQMSCSNYKKRKLKTSFADTPKKQYSKRNRIHLEESTCCDEVNINSKIKNLSECNSLSHIDDDPTQNSLKVCPAKTVLVDQKYIDLHTTDQTSNLSDVTVAPKSSRKMQHSSNYTLIKQIDYKAMNPVKFSNKFLNDKQSNQAVEECGHSGNKFENKTEQSNAWYLSKPFSIVVKDIKLNSSHTCANKSLYNSDVTKNYNTSPSPDESEMLGMKELNIMSYDALTALSFPSPTIMRCEDDVIHISPNSPIHYEDDITILESPIASNCSDVFQNPVGATVLPKYDVSISTPTKCPLRYNKILLGRTTTGEQCVSSEFTQEEQIKNFNDSSQLAMLGKVKSYEGGTMKKPPEAISCLEKTVICDGDGECGIADLMIPTVRSREKSTDALSHEEYGQDVNATYYIDSPSSITLNIIDPQNIQTPIESVQFIRDKEIVEPTGSICNLESFYAAQKSSGLIEIPSKKLRGEIIKSLSDVCNDDIGSAESNKNLSVASNTKESLSREKNNSFIVYDTESCVITPATRPPSSDEIMKTLRRYDLPEVVYKLACYGSQHGSVNNQSDTRESKQRSKIPLNCSRFAGSLSLLQDKQLQSYSNSSIMSQDVDTLSHYRELQPILLGSKPVVITPCKSAPTKKFISKSLKSCRKLQTERPSLGLDRASCKTLESNDGEKMASKSSQTACNLNNVCGMLTQSQQEIGFSLFSPVKSEVGSVFANTKTPAVTAATPALSHSTPGCSFKVKMSDSFQEKMTQDSKGDCLQRFNTVKKLITPVSSERINTSDIEAVTPNNTYGFDITQENLNNAKALHVKQHLSLVSIELHIDTRRDMKPDPTIDSIRAIFYFIHEDASVPDENFEHSGVFVLQHSMQNCTSSRKQQNVNKISLSTAGIYCESIHNYDEEVTMLIEFANMIQNTDPDLLLGYEVQMSSWGYIIERAAVLDINMCQRLSRVFETRKMQVAPESNDKEFHHFGQLNTATIPGRIILNVWRVMRSEVTLRRYSFENVAFHVLHQRLPEYSFRNLSDWWNSNTSRWRVCQHYFARCKANYSLLNHIDFINRTSELARVFGILFYAVISRGSQFRVESMMLRIAKPMNYVPVSPCFQQIAKMPAPECIPLVMEPESNFYVDPVIVLDFQSLYPSIIIAYNYCYSTCLGKVSLFSQNETYRFGATSLHLPTECLQTLITDNMLHISPNGVGFVTADVKKGILPSMLDGILNTRIMVKTAMKKATEDKTLHRMLDSRQLGLKLIANVTYGYTSANFSGRMPCIELDICTQNCLFSTQKMLFCILLSGFLQYCTDPIVSTVNENSAHKIGDSVVRKGRETLERAIQLVNTTKRWNAKVVYGDTDSLFVLLKGASKKTAFTIGKEIVDEVTALNPKPVKLKFEKVYQPCVLLTKKRYVGYMYETLDQKEPVFDAKGIETVRRDGCPAVSKILEKSLKLLFDTKDLSLIKSYVQTQFMKVMEGNVALQDFTFAKEYRGMNSYKPGACVPALMISRKLLKQDRRSEPRIGERVPYVIVHGTPGLPLIQLVQRPLDVLQNSNLRLNDTYYITRQFCPALDRVFSLLDVNVKNWYAELPRNKRVHNCEMQQTNRKKGMISQYFTSSHCPVCEQLTTRTICEQCCRNSQETVITLSSRIQRIERRYGNLTRLCQHCSGARDIRTNCISLDCPIFYKLCSATKDLYKIEQFKNYIKFIQ